MFRRWLSKAPDLQLAFYAGTMESLSQSKHTSHKVLEIYEAIKEKSLTPTVQILNCLLSAHLKLNDTREAYKVVQEIDRLGPNEATFEILCKDIVHRPSHPDILTFISSMFERYNVKQRVLLASWVVANEIKRTHIQRFAFAYRDFKKAFRVIPALAYENLIDIALKNRRNEVASFLFEECASAKIDLKAKLYYDGAYLAAVCSDKRLLHTCFDKLGRMSLDEGFLMQMLMFGGREGDLPVAKKAFSMIVKMRGNALQYHLAPLLDAAANAKDLKTVESVYCIWKKNFSLLDADLKHVDAMLCGSLDVFNQALQSKVLKESLMRACIAHCRFDLADSLYAEFNLINPYLTVLLAQNKLQEAIRLKDAFDEQSYFIVCSYLVKGEMDHLALALNYIRHLTLHDKQRLVNRIRFKSRSPIEADILVKMLSKLDDQGFIEEAT